MKLLSFEARGAQSWGLIKGDGVVDLGRRMRARFPSLRAALGRNALAAIEELAAGYGADIGLADIHYLPPIPDPEKIICVGVNYADRNAEYRDGSELPQYPSIFLRVPGSVVGHGEPLVRPRESVQFDYEGEIALIIGKEGRRIPEEDAWSYVAGLSCFNEGSVRDWLRHGKFNVTQGKNFDRSGAFGPYIVTASEFKETGPFEVTTFVNAEPRQHDTTENLMFDFAYLLRYLSTFMTLKPGDVIATGTPNGAGARFDPPKWLKGGDIVEVKVSGVGRLKNEVVEER